MKDSVKAKWQSLSKPAQASLAIICCRVFQLVIATLVTPVFTRLMSTDEYGTYTVIISWAEVIGLFSTLNLADASFQQALVKYDKRKDELTAAVAGLGTVVSLLLLGCYFLLRKRLDPLFGFGADIFTCIILLSWACLMGDLWTAHQKNEYRYKAKIFVTILISVSEALIGIAAVYLVREHKAEVRFLTVVLTETLIYGSFFILFLKKGRLFDKELWRYFLSLSVPLLPHYLTAIVLNQSDRIMIKNLVGESEAGIYGLGRNLAWVLCLVTAAVIHSMKPWLFKRIKAHELENVGKTVYLMLALVAVLGTGIVLVTPEAIYILAPEEYHSAAMVIAPLVVSVYFIFMCELFSCFEFYYEKTKMITLASLTVGILNIVLNYILIERFGWVAAAFTTLICHACLAVIHFVNMSRILRTTGDMKVFDPIAVFLISIAFTGIVFLVMALYDHIVIRYLIVLICMTGLILKRKEIMKLLH